MSQLASGAAWQALRDQVETLAPALRRDLSAAWATDAQFEHASIASFGRFALELLAVGAPAELVERAHRAAIDEVGHARLCFSLASLYAGSALGPGPLPLDASAFAVAPNLVSMAHATVLEGCVNETLAALEAEAAHRSAEPQAVRAALEVIVSQESDHASLAFAFVRWAVGVGGEPVRAVVRDAFAQAGEQLRAASVPVLPEPEPQLARHGRLSPAQRNIVRVRGYAEVIAPAAAELLGG